MNIMGRSFFILLLLLGLGGLGRPIPVPAADHDGGNEHAHTIWTCSMHPQIQLPEAGKCPICFMDLIEVTIDTDDDQGLRQVSLDSRARNLARVETRPVVRRRASAEIRMVGKVDYDETRMSAITAWMNGRIDKLHISYTGSAVRQGQAMAEIYSPDLLTAQAELIQAVRAAERLGSSDSGVLKNTIQRTEDAARAKLRLLGLDDRQIANVIKRGETSDHITLTAPISGIVIKKEVVEGMYVRVGTPIYTIADLNHLWVILEAYESDLHALNLGQRADFFVEAFAGTAFSGRISYIDPLVNEKTRTVRVRLNVDNRDGRLKPGMFVRALTWTPLDPSGEPPLLIPASAPLITGKRALVYIQIPDREGVYEGREIILGPRRGDFYEVRKGLEENELVVTRGNFKIDAAAQLQARPSMMNPYQATERSAPDELDPLFASRLRLLNDKFNAFNGAAHDFAHARALDELNGFNDILQKVDGEKLTAPDKSAWNELAMLLQSDVILLQEADDNKEFRRLHSVITEHFAELRERFSLDALPVVAEGPGSYAEKLAALFHNYEQLRQDLFADSGDRALADIPALLAAAQAVDAELKTASHPQAIKAAENIGKGIEKLRAATGIEHIREGFYPLSSGLTLAVTIFGIEHSGPIYEQYCPMAFNNQGAGWLATEEQIDNPYFGAAMPHCGEVRQQLKE